MAKKHTQRSLTAWQADYEKSEEFTKSEWFQAILTSLVAWLLGQGYSMVARGKR